MQLRPNSAFPLNTYIQGSGYPILCLHGHPGTGKSMSVFTRHLSKRFKTLAPDLRGYGGSRPTNDFELEDHLIDLEALLDQQQIDRCLLLGWSLGGIFAIELALKFPERISGLILVATAARPWSSHPPVSWEDNLLTGIASLINLVKPGWQWNIDTFGKRSLYRYLIQQHTAAAYQYLAAEGTSAYLQTSAAASRALNRAIRNGYNRLAHLDRITCPVLMLAGTEDRHITAAASLETAKALPNCQTHCYEGVAHLFPWEIPDQVLRDIDAWIAQHSEMITFDR
ncbi:MAG: alpha/beta hydrolase [Elainella sp. C42_A2020_010]|nr:alpha/beta hydrolase [Elainella sp. C42_A2020_010]